MTVNFLFKQLFRFSKRVRTIANNRHYRYNCFESTIEIIDKKLNAIAFHD